MKIAIVLILIICCFVNNSLGSPLIFKVSKNITSKDLIEIGSFDATRFRQIRFGIKIKSTSTKLPISKIEAEIELNAARRELKRYETLLESGNISRSEYDRVADRARLAQQKYDNADDLVNSTVYILGIEGDEEIIIASLSERETNRSFIIDSPPSKIKVKASGNCIISVYVWGQ